LAFFFSQLYLSRERHLGSELKISLLKTAIFREDATSYVARFHAGLLSRSNWNFVLFVLGWRVGESKNPEKNPLEKAKTSNKLNPVMERARNQATLATLVGAERSHHCVVPQYNVTDRLN